MPQSEVALKVQNQNQPESEKVREAADRDAPWQSVATELTTTSPRPVIREHHSQSVP